MNREDFTEGSVEMALFDLWSGDKDKDFVSYLLLDCITKRELVDFIMLAQSKGVFGNGYIHP